LRTFISLVKILLNMNFSISALRYKFKTGQKGKWETVAVFISIAVIVLFMMPFYILFSLGLFIAARQLNQPEIVLALVYIAGQIIVLFFGVIMTMSSFFFSNDIRNLIPLPLTPAQVIGAKFVVLMVNEYLLLVPILLPPFIIYGIGMKCGVLYWFKALILILLSPAVPLMIDSLIIILLMRFVNLRKSKDLMAVIGGLFGIFLSVGINIFIQTYMQNFKPQEFFPEFLAGSGSIVDMIASRFPPGIWAVYALSRTGLEGLGYLGLYILLSLALLYLFLALANKVFYKSVLAGQETARKGQRAKNDVAIKEKSKVSSPVMAIYMKEWKILLRTPVYVLNGLVGAFLGPIILVLMMFTKEGMGELVILAQNPRNAMYFSLAGLGLMLFTSGMNVVASTAISREGSTFWISKVIPQKPEVQVKGKLLHGLSISALSILLVAVIFPLIFKIDLIRIIAVTAISCTSSVTLISLGLIIDILMPKLEWSNPQEAMKQNTNGVLGMLASMVFMGLIALLTVLLVVLKAAEWILYLALFVFSLVLAVISVKVLYKTAAKQYQSIEA